MPAALTVAEYNALLDYAASRITHISGHSADPGNNGANELVGGSYARQPISWNAAASGNVDMIGTETIPVPDGQALSHIGLWSALTSGTYRGAIPVPNGPIASPVGSYLVSDLDLNLPGGL